MASRIKKVIIPVAGLGTRGLPFSKEVPKELLPVIDIPTIHFVVEEAVASGMEQIILITGKGKSSIEDYFDRSPVLEYWLEKRGKAALAERIRQIGNMCEIISVRQKDPRGLGHAVQCAQNVVGGESFAVALGDEIYPIWDARPPALKQLTDAAAKNAVSVVGVQQVARNETASYGIIDIGGKILENVPLPVLKTIEKPSPERAPSCYALTGRYVFDPIIFDCLKEVSPGVGGEIQLTDAMAMLCESNKLQALRLDASRYDMGSPLSAIKAQIDAGLQRPDLKDELRKYLKSL